MLTDRLEGGDVPRSEAADQLEECYEVVLTTILSRQNPLTGLLATNDEERHAWVRDNVSSISAV